jgi:transcriptional regulator with XRE-family HTH domain
MFRNLEAEQSRYGLTNQAVAEKLGVSRVTYENKKKNGNFTRPQIVLLMQLFNCSFDYLFETDQEESA